MKPQKDVAADAESIAEAATRATMRTIAVKDTQTQALGMAFWARDILVRQQTRTINALRGHLAEFGVLAPKGQFISNGCARMIGPEAELPNDVIEIA